MSSHGLPTWHMLLILPGKSCILYLPGQLLQEFRIQITCFANPPSFGLISVMASMLNETTVCSLPLSLTLNCGLTEVRNCAWFTSPQHLARGLDKRTFKHMLSSFILSFNKYLLSIYLTSSVLGAGDTVEYKIGIKPCFQWVYILFCWMAGQRYVWMNELMPKGINEWKRHFSQMLLYHT